MKQQENGSILLILLFFISLFTIYLGIVYKQVSYVSDQLYAQYRLEQERYALETVLWWGVALCVDQFETLQKLCAQNGTCLLPTEPLARLMQQTKQPLQDITLSIQMRTPEELLCTARASGYALSCVCYRDAKTERSWIREWQYQKVQN